MKKGGRILEEKSKRIYYLDSLKILLCVLVIIHHTTIAYGGSGGWYYIEEVNNAAVNIIFTIFNAVCQSFFMGLFFFISAYFILSSYNRKGTYNFIKDRLIRLLIPLCIFYFILHPTTIYFVERVKSGHTISYLKYMYTCITQIDNMGFGPLWFVEALLIFSLLFVLYMKISKPEKPKNDDFPSRKVVIIFMILWGLISFIVRLFFPTEKEVLGMKLGYFTQYILLFILGIKAYKNNWLHKLTDEISSFYFNISLICFVMLIGICAIFVISGDDSLEAFFGGMNIMAFIYALWEPFMCVGISLKLITIFRNKCNKKSNLCTSLALDTYPVYVIHAPVNVFLECMLVSSALNPIVKCTIVCIFTCIFCFFISHYILRKVILLRKIF